MNRIGWFVVCLVVAAAADQNSLGKRIPIENRGDLNSITKLKRVSEITDPDLKEISNFFDDLFGSETEFRDQENEGRTFGLKRVQFMMMAPMMYKMGVMTTMLMVLTAISLKGLLIGLILLVLKLSSFLAKFHTGWYQQGHGQTWPQPVHVHVHGNDPHHGHSQAYSGWSSANGPISDEEQHYYYKG